MISCLLGQNLKIKTQYFEIELMKVKWLIFCQMYFQMEIFITELPFDDETFKKIILEQ